jgi:hypothetical protein
MSASLPIESVKRLLPWLVAVAFFMESLDTTILNTAAPAIADALGIAPLSMNTLVFADLPDADTSPGSSISSIAQQMSMSLGVAVSSLLAALFLQGEHRPGPQAMVSGVHWTFLTPGLMTIAPSFIFSQLRPGDGAAISQHRI